MGGTLPRTPVPRLGSTMIGRCDSACTAGTADRSRVLRVAVSKVRMPRSHRITSSAPLASRYSADMSRSRTLAPMPRLSITGLPMAPTRRSRSKFCMLRAPICSTSTSSAISARWSGDEASDTTGIPWRSPASRR